MEITLTELFLFLWAALATGFWLMYRERYNVVTLLLYKISTNREIRKQFFDAHDKHFGELIK